jgi:tripartite-type tricarboxylate transporter receptor subunit TctC
MKRLRSVLALALLASIVSTVPAIAQDAYPSRPIRFVLPYAVGGAADALARAIAEELRERLGQTVIVDSRPGANSMLGAELVARSAPDGYTILYLGWPTISTNLVMFKKVTYKLEDFQPITTFYRTPVGITVRKDLPVANLKELIEYAKSKGSLAFGTSGIGSSPHMLLERINRLQGTKFEHVAYRGEAPAVADVLGGHIPVFAGSVATPGEHIKNGALKLISVSSAERLTAFPDVPTFKEQGIDIDFSFWHGIAAPAGTPKPVVDKLHAAIVAALGTQRVKNVLTPDQVVATLSPEAFTDLIKRDIATWGPIIRDANLVVD